MNPWVIILAAGSGSRLAGSGLNTKKQFLSWKGLPLYWHSVSAFLPIPSLRGCVLVFPEEGYDNAVLEVSSLHKQSGGSIPLITAMGGALRQDSVYHGLKKLPGKCSHVLIHDGARPFVSAGLIQRVLDALDQGADGVVPAIPVTDTIKEIKNRRVIQTLDRSVLARVQTPQGFDRLSLIRSHERAREKNLAVTDDASFLEECGYTVHTVQGEDANMKITTPADLDLLKSSSPALHCSGFGYDVHKYGKDGTEMVIGGIPLPRGPRVLAHSDGDVLIHALCDAILGCMGEGDIGEHFPDTDPRWKGVSSGVLLGEVLHKAKVNRLILDHVDLTIVAQTPKLSPFKEQIRNSLASILDLERCRVNIKATTEEGMGFTGEKQGIKAYALVTAHILSP